MTLDEILNGLFPSGHDVKAKAAGIILGTGKRKQGEAIAVIGVANGAALGTAGVLPLAQEVLRVVANGGNIPILVLVDTQGQLMARRDEMRGLNEYLAHLAKCLLLASQQGHRTIGLEYGQAAAGAFLATALATYFLVGLPDAEPVVMDLPSMSRVTKLPIGNRRQARDLVGNIDPARSRHAPEFVDLAHEIDVPEVHLQRLVYFPEGQGLARPEQALFESLDTTEESSIREAEARATAHGITFDASGATEPGTSLRRAGDRRPWSLCTRPWTLMYFTAHGRVLPCCIAPFSMRGYDSFTLGDATQQTLREIWNGDAYRAFRRGLLSDHPPRACASCGLRWSL